MALFNRFKSQSVSTKYLALKNQTFIGKSNDFDAFLIWNVRDPRLPSCTEEPRNDIVDGEIVPRNPIDITDADYWTLKYGQIVRLQHVQSGLLSKPFILCRVADRNWIEFNLSNGEMHESLSQVAQLQRIALMAISENFEFMSLEKETITLLPSLRGETFENAGKFELGEGSIWTLCSLGNIVYIYDRSNRIQFLYPKIQTTFQLKS